MVSLLPFLRFLSLSCFLFVVSLQKQATKAMFSPGNLVDRIWLEPGKQMGDVFHQTTKSYSLLVGEQISPPSIVGASTLFLGDMARVYWGIRLLEGNTGWPNGSFLSFLFCCFPSKASKHHPWIESDVH